MVLGCCRAGWARNAPNLPRFCRGHGSPADTTAALQAMHARSEIHERVCPNCFSKKSFLWCKSIFFVFSGIPLAQQILNREVATATLPVCRKEGFHPSIKDKTIWLLWGAHNSFTWPLMKPTLPWCLLQKLSTFLKEIRFKSQQGYEFSWIYLVTHVRYSQQWDNLTFGIASKT